MYPLFLTLAALFIIFLLSTRWPVKFYHHHVLKKIGAVLGVEPVRNSLFFAGVFAEIKTVLAGKELRIRFVEGSIDSLRADSGLEIRFPCDLDVVIQFYRSGSKMKAWGDFQQIITGDKMIDSQWVILSNQPETATSYCRTETVGALLTIRRINQILLYPEEMVIRLKNGDEARTVSEVVKCLQIAAESNDSMLTSKDWE